MAYGNKPWYRRGKSMFRGTPKTRSVIVKRKRRSNYSGLRLSAPMRNLVDRSIHKNIETKQAIVQISGGGAYGLPVQVIPSAAGNGNGGMFSVLPRIAQGDLRDQRQGSQIKVRSCRVTCYCVLPAATVGSQTDRSMIEMRVICGSTKGRLNYTSLYDDTGATMSNIMRTGTSSDAFLGDFQHINLPLNHAVVTKHYDRNMILKTVTGNGDTVSNAVYKFSFNVPLKNKVLRYVEQEAYPRNAAPWLAVGWNYTNSAAGLPVAIPNFWYQTVLNYEDA